MISTVTVNERAGLKCAFIIDRHAGQAVTCGKPADIERVGHDGKLPRISICARHARRYAAVMKGEGNG